MAKRNRRKKAAQLVRAAFRRTAEQQRQIDELRRSNAASPHVPKHRRGTRAVKAKRAIDDQL